MNQGVAGRLAKHKKTFSGLAINALPTSNTKETNYFSTSGPSYKVIVTAIRNWFLGRYRKCRAVSWEHKRTQVGEAIESCPHIDKREVHEGTKEVPGKLFAECYADEIALNARAPQPV